MLKQLFCKHLYEYKGVVECTYRERMEDDKQIKLVQFYECKKCGKRIIIKDRDYYFNDSILKQFDLWKKYQLELKFDDEEYEEDEQQD